MTMLTKAMTGALLLSISTASLVNVASANTETSNGTVSFTDDAGTLVLIDADNITFGEIDLSTITNLMPVATNSETGKLTLLQTAANPKGLTWETGIYSVTVQQTGDWIGGASMPKENLPIKLGLDSLAAAAVTAVPHTGRPNSRGIHESAFQQIDNFRLDLTGSVNLTDVVNQSLTSEVTWTLTDGM
ncbi:chitinase [Leuconostoc falkenbergense]|uniref:chitinase n=1 Tax=Leuconostoc falkenbergense TaxID=2766470 RepID=UPI0024A892CB|nr:chitinase [Leuconostoc falkenbergense]MDI6553502.1 chitinase [Leuconostoc falkenbergense]